LKCVLDSNVALRSFPNYVDFKNANDIHSMTKHRSRLRLWRLMVAVAFVALLLKWLPAVLAVASVGIILVVRIPFASSPPERRLAIAVWTVTLHPVMIPVYLYATGVTAWWVLGHCPRLSLNDPKRLGLSIAGPIAMTFLSYLTWPISSVTAFFLWVDWCRRRPFLYLRLIIVPIACGWRRSSP
jgi:hypothetical protein